MNDSPVNIDLHTFNHKDPLQILVVNERREWPKGIVLLAYLHEHLHGYWLSAGQHDHFYEENFTKNVKFAADPVAPGVVVTVVFDGGFHESGKVLEGLAGALGGVEGHRDVGDEEKGDVSLVDRHSLKVEWERWIEVNKEPLLIKKYALDFYMQNLFSIAEFAKPSVFHVESLELGES